MKKLTSLLLPVAILGLTGAALAAGNTTPNAGNQGASLSIYAQAEIPCFLELSFEGNGISEKLNSYGAGVKAVAEVPTSADPHCIIFRPGASNSTFVSESWDTIGAKSLSPGPGVYISSCDIFKTTIWSNLDYTYSVQSSDLVGVDMAAGATLPLYMRYKLDGDKAFSATQRMGSATMIPFPTNGAHNRLNTTVLLQQFRVPFDRTVPAGVYKGRVVVTAATL